MNGKVADVTRIHTGFRKAEYKGGAGAGGVWLNDKYVWLTGYSQRASNDWPGLGSTPDIHIIGHWNYPANTKKAVYVIASHCDSVELFLNGKSLGVNKTPENGCTYEFPNVAFAPGSLKAVARRDGKVVAQHELKTAGEATSVKLTLHTGPEGLLADGCDVALIDFEVVDAQGNRCPTDEARVDFTISGPAIWRGGFNAGKLNTTNNLYLDTECGINRVAVRSTLTAGTITVTATRDGLRSATITLNSNPVAIENGLSHWMPQQLPAPVK